MADSPNTTTMTEIPRQIVEAEIERLIGLLDVLDPDPDLESTSDEEPWLGAPAGIHANGHGTNWEGLNSQGHHDREDDGDDREEVSEDEGAQCDDECEIHGDAEPDYHGEGTGNQQGPCSPISTLIGGDRHA